MPMNREWLFQTLEAGREPGADDGIVSVAQAQDILRAFDALTVKADKVEEAGRVAAQATETARKAQARTETLEQGMATQREELDRLKSVEIQPLADHLLKYHGGPLEGESACEMAVRLLTADPDVPTGP